MYLDLVTFGGTGDSYFEYLLKQYLLTEETESIYLNMYHSAIDSLFSRVSGSVDVDS